MRASLRVVGSPAGIPFGNYQLLRRLARGGMAEVFLARQGGLEGFNRVVAIKRILPHLVDNDGFVRMFLDEARLAARLSHPNVIHIYEFGKVDEHYFIAMEFMPGVHVGDLIRFASREHLPEALVARIAADACAGLHYAHQLTDELGSPLRIVHRDVSPPNLLVSYDGVVKIVDFGIAKAASCVEQTRTGVVKGKYAYMSPEQTTGKRLDGRSDVFSLGLVLWELFAGRVAVMRDDQVAAMRMIRDGKVPDIREVRPDLPEGLIAALSGALAVRPDDRCDARELGVALEEFIKSSDHIASGMEVGQWIRDRFPPEPLFEAPGTGTVQATQATRATAASAVSLAGLGAPGMPLGQPAPADDSALLAVPPTMGSRPVGAIDAIGSASDATRALRTPPGLAAVDDGHDFTIPLDTAYADRLQDGDDAGGHGGEHDHEEFATTEDVPPPHLSAPPTYADPPHTLASSPPYLQPPTHTEALPARSAGRRWVIGSLLLLAGSGSAALVAASVSGSSAVTPEPVLVLDSGVADAVPTPDAAQVAAPDASIDAAPERAVLEIVTRPAGAKVSLEDQESRPSPALFRDIEPGEHEVIVRLEGHAPVKRRIRVDAGEHRTLDLVLDELEKVATPAEVASAERERKRRERERERERERKRRASFGELKVRTRPYSVVYHRGKRLGTTPLVGVKLPPGRYRLTFKNPDTKPVTRTVEVKANETTKLDFELGK